MRKPAFHGEEIPTKTPDRTGMASIVFCTLFSLTIFIMAHVSCKWHATHVDASDRVWIAIAALLLFGALMFLPQPHLRCYYLHNPYCAWHEANDCESP